MTHNQPNAQGALVLELNRFVKPFMAHTNAQQVLTNQSVHALASDPISQLEEPIQNYPFCGYLRIEVTIKEAWLISGVLTPTSVGQYTNYYDYHNAQLSLQQGLNFDYLDYLDNNRVVITDDPAFADCPCD